MLGKERREGGAGTCSGHGRRLKCRPGWYETQCAWCKTSHKFGSCMCFCAEDEQSYASNVEGFSVKCFNVTRNRSACHLCQRQRLHIRQKKRDVRVLPAATACITTQKQDDAKKVLPVHDFGEVPAQSTGSADDEQSAHATGVVVEGESC